MDCSWKRVFFVFLSLAPLLGESCSCFHFSDRSETLSDGICDGEVYSGVVVGATCSCLEGTDLVDCREYSFSESNNAYSAEVLRRVKLNVSHSFGIIKTCPQAAETLAPGVSFPTGVEPEVVTRSEPRLMVCPFNDNGTDYLVDGFVCVYRIRVTEVFVGNFSVGDVITRAGPDTGTSCSPELGRILQLRTEYLAGVGGPCSSAFNDWSLLSRYSDKDLATLRELAETRDPETCGGSALGAAAAVVLLTAGLISSLM